MRTLIKTWSTNEGRAGKRLAILHSWGLGFESIAAKPSAVHFTFRIIESKSEQPQYISFEVGDEDAAKMYQSLRDYRERKGLRL